MILFLLKSGACLLILWGLYVLLLRKESFYRFNRWYLLGSLVVSYVIPLCVIEVQYIEAPLQRERYQEEVREEIHLFPILPQTPSSVKISWKAIYLAGLTLMAFRFLWNLSKIWQLVLRGNRKSDPSFRVISHPKVQHSFSFFSYIFLPQNQSLEQEEYDLLLQHEQAHVDQGHSWDILLIEILLCVCWFNPILILYRRAIRLNHEFLADKAVLWNISDPTPYLALLYNSLTTSQLLPATSNFSYGHIQNRILMMNKQSKPSQAFIRKAMIFPTVIGLLLVFGQSQTLVNPIDPIPAETEVPISPKSSQVPVPIYELYHYNGGMRAITFDPKGEEMNLPFEPIFGPGEKKKKYILAYVDGASKLSFVTPEGKRVEKIVWDLTKAEREWIWKLDQSQARYYYGPQPQKQPPQKEWESFLNPKEYGVWLDGNPIGNGELRKYSPTDIHHYGVSRLMKNAANYGKHTYQVNITTHKAVERQYGPGGKGFWKPIILDGSFAPPFVWPSQEK